MLDRMEKEPPVLRSWGTGAACRRPVPWLPRTCPSSMRTP